MRRKKLLGAIGAVATLAGVGGGALAAGRTLREARFYRNFTTGLALAAAGHRARRSAAIHENIQPKVALELVSEHHEFDVVYRDLFVTVEVGLPDNQDVTRLTVVVGGMERALMVLRRLIMTSKRPELAAEGVGSITHAALGSEFTFTLLVADDSYGETQSLQQKLNYDQ